MFLQGRNSVEHERSYLLARRKHDEFWFAEKFGLKWPRLLASAATASSASPLSESTRPGPVFAAQVAVAGLLSPSPPPQDKPIPAPTAACDAASPPANGTCPIDNINTGCRKNLSSAAPIRYFDGEIQLSVADISSDAFGVTWEHRRTYSNQLSFNGDIGQGYCWLNIHSPYLWYDTVNPTSIVVVRGSAGSLWFDVAGPGYVGRYGSKSTLTHDPVARTFTVTYPTGYVQVFLDFSYAFPLGGVFSQQIEAGGQITSAMGYNSAGVVTEFQRSSTVSGVTDTESFVYSFDSVGDVASVLLRRQVNGGAWSNVRRAVYTYHDGSDSFGSAGDLKLVEIQLPAGTGWTDFETTYYRYYTSDTAPGFVHGLKYVLNPASY